MARKKPWKFVPSAKPKDQLYNRRLLSYYCLFFTALWFQEILIVVLIGVLTDTPMDAGVVAALLGAPAALTGLGFWKYLQACQNNMDPEKALESWVDKIPDDEMPEGFPSADEMIHKSKRGGI